jgi:hypothetical protein
LVKALKFAGIISICLVLFRQSIFNLIVDFEPVHEVPIEKLESKYWKHKVEGIIENNEGEDLHLINAKILTLLANQIEFGKEQSSNSVNEFRRNSVAHCVGFASLNASLLNYAIEIMEEEGVTVKHTRGHVNVFGKRITNSLNSKFFKDHDFVQIIDTKNKKSYFSDGSVYKYLKINKIK